MPTGLSAVPGYQAANLSWTVGADNGNAITSFLVTWAVFTPDRPKRGVDK